MQRDACSLLRVRTVWISDLLVRVCGAADVFVFPSLSETFGLVMLEAMACGTPVAAFPVPGPLDVVGRSRGGVLDTDLRAASLAALALPRDGPLARAREFDWQRVSDQFVSFLVPAHRGAVTQVSRKLHTLAR